MRSRLGRGAADLIRFFRKPGKPVRGCPTNHGVIGPSPELITPLFPGLESKGKALLNTCTFTPFTGHR
jgi:hypothetical protein